MMPEAPRTFVVFECRVGTRNVWAWCVWDTGPGFNDIFFTENDGITAAELDQAPTLDRYMFTVTEGGGEGRDR